MRRSLDLFRSRRIGHFFLVGAAASFAVAIVGAPVLIGSTSVLRSILVGGLLGLIGSAARFLLLKFLDRR